MRAATVVIGVAFAGFLTGSSLVGDLVGLTAVAYGLVLAALPGAVAVASVSARAPRHPMAAGR